MPEPWKRPRKVETQREYLVCRQRIEKMVAEGIMTLEEIANNPPGDSMKRQARKMWREQEKEGVPSKVEKLPISSDKLQANILQVKGRWKINFVTNGFVGQGSLEEMRKKATEDIISKLVEYCMGRISFENVFYLKAEKLDSKVASRGKISSIAVKR